MGNSGEILIIAASWHTHTEQRTIVHYNRRVHYHSNDLATLYCTSGLLGRYHEINGKLGFPNNLTGQDLAALVVEMELLGLSPA